MATIKVWVFQTGDEYRIICDRAYVKQGDDIEWESGDVGGTPQEYPFVVDLGEHSPVEETIGTNIKKTKEKMKANPKAGGGFEIRGNKKIKNIGVVENPRKIKYSIAVAIPADPNVPNDKLKVAIEDPEIIIDP